MRDRNIVCSKNRVMESWSQRVKRQRIYLFCVMIFIYCLPILGGCAASQKNRYIQKRDNIIRDEARIQIDEEKKKRAESLFNSGFNLINNDPVSANALYREGITLMPERWEAYYNLGITYMKLSDHEMAIKEFSNALKYNAPPSKVYNAIGITYQYMGRNGDAVSYFKKALSVERSPIILMNIANIYQNMGQMDEAIKFYNQIELTDISNLPIHTNRGILRYKTGDYKAAMDEFNKALIKEGENMKLLYYQAQTYLMLGKYENALNIYQRIASKNPSDPEPYKNIGIIYEIYLGDMVSAYENYNEYLKNGGEKTKDMESWIEVVKAKSPKNEKH